MKHYGFIPPVVDNTHFVLGGIYSLPKVVIKADGQWDADLPTYEAQYSELFDTHNCTAYGSINCWEIILKAKYGLNSNYSERALGILAGTRPPGNDPQKVCDTARKSGLIDDEVLPLKSAFNVEEYYSPDPLTGSLLAKGQNWLTKFSIGHEWLWTGNEPLKSQQEKMLEALKYSPLGVAVFAWKRDGDIYVRPKGSSDVHWCVIYGYKKGQYWKCFDTYDGGTKKLAWDFGFNYVKRFHIEKKVSKTYWFTDIYTALCGLILDLFTKRYK